MVDFITVKNRRIGKDYEPFIVAEMSANHNQDLNRAIKIIEKASEAGADAIKLQTYRHDTLTIDSKSPDFMINEGIWSGKSLYELYKEAHLPWDWHKELYSVAESLGLSIFSSPFDETAVDFLETLETPVYKVASFEIIDLPLIKHIAQTKKPIIISTGLAGEKEIEEAISCAYENGCNEVMILHCISSYPAQVDQYNLKMVLDMQRRFKVPVGLSDHTTDTTVAIASISHGASLIEKHFTLDSLGGGIDDSFSVDPRKFKELCDKCRESWKAQGNVNYRRSDSERINKKYRRSLYIVKDIDAGDELDKENVSSIRPGFGISPKYLEKILGKRVRVALTKGTPLTSDIVDKYLYDS